MASRGRKLIFVIKIVSSDEIFDFYIAHFKPNNYLKVEIKL
jgi:hypothetical protein